MDYVSLLSVASSFVATFGGIIVSGKLTSYRIEQLEKKVEKLADINEKVLLLEEKLNVTRQKVEGLEADMRKIDII